jgi:hypothetical protein
VKFCAENKAIRLLLSNLENLEKLTDSWGLSQEHKPDMYLQVIEILSKAKDDLNK